MPRRRRVHRNDSPQEQGRTSRHLQQPSATPPIQVQLAGPALETLQELPDHPTSLSLRQMSALQTQQQVGNLQTQAVLRRKSDHLIVQRVVINQAQTTETLHNQVDPTTGQYRSNTYYVGSVTQQGNIGDIRYEMTRGSRGVNINVRIKFVQAFGSGGTAAQPVPEGDARTQASNICRDLVQFWNNKFELVGRTNPGAIRRFFGAEPQEVLLPLTFTATPVFDLSAAAHSTVQFDPTTSATGAPGQVVDAAHWFANLNPANYAGTVADTYAHEYGHLLGIPDEYSLSNPNAHALMHRVSPSQATQMNQALDRAGMREMMLAALSPQLQDRLGSVAGDISAAFAAQRNNLARNLAQGLRSAWQSGPNTAVRDRIRSLLEGAGADRALPLLERALNFQIGPNLSNLTIANNAIAAQLDPDQMEALVRAICQRATLAAGRQTITIPYTNDRGNPANMSVRVQVAPAVASSSSPLAASATQIANIAVGAPEPPTGRRRTNLYPSNTLMGQITALPTRWSNISAGIAAAVNELPAILSQMAEQVIANSDIPGSVANTPRGLYRTLLGLVNNASQAAVEQALSNFFNAQMRPLIQQQVDQLMTMIDAEITRQTSATATGTGTTVSPDTPPDPTLMAQVRQMQQAAQAMLNPAPATPGGAAPQQNVRYSMNSLMGSNAFGQSLRTDQFSNIVTQFNATQPDLRHNDEDNFIIRSKT